MRNVFLFLAAFIGLIALIYAATVLNVAVTPAALVNKTLDPNNIINNYEWFHDAHGNYNAKVRQITNHRAFLANETDPGEKNRLRIELAAQQQSCRELAERYNANATKSNRSLFMGKTAPHELNPAECG